LSATFVVIFCSIFDAGSASGQGRQKVVLLGDSYIAGNGARKDDGSTDNFGPKGCYRSNSNWGSKYVGELKSIGNNITLVNRACSGSVSNDLLYPNAMEATESWARSYAQLGIPSDAGDEDIYSAINSQYSCSEDRRGEEFYQFSIDSKSDSMVNFSCRRHLDAQLDFVDESVDVVLLSIGGNDIEFSNIVMSCLSPVVSSVDQCGSQIVESESRARSTEQGSYQKNMELIFKKLREKMRSDAKIVLLGYPYLAKDDNFILKDLFNPLTYEASKNVRALGELGDRIQLLTIPPNEPDKTQIYFYGGVKPHFVGHEPDMNDFWHHNSEKWIHTFGSRISTDWFHYNPIGHQEVANNLYANLEDYVDGFPLKTQLDYDVVFVVNHASEAQQYQRDDLPIKGITIGKIRDKILSVANTARFGLVSYNLWAGSEGRDGPKSIVSQDFTFDPLQLSKHTPRNTTLAGRTQPGELRNALHRALDLKWRPGVKKLVYIIGKTKSDDAGQNPQEFYSDVIEKSLHIDPVAISPIMASNNFGLDDQAAQVLAQQTEGRYITSGRSQDYSSTWILKQAEKYSVSTPYAWAGEGLNAKVGEAVELDGSGSYDEMGIVSYDWDINTDGIYDIFSSESSASYSYDSEYQGLITLRVTNTDGKTATATFPAVITQDGDSVETSIDNCPDDWNEEQSDADNDGVGDVCDATPGLEGYFDPAQVDEEPTSKVETDLIDSVQATDSVAPAVATSTSANLNSQFYTPPGAAIPQLEVKTNEETGRLKNEDALKAGFASTGKEPSGSWWRILFAVGSVTGLGSAMWLLNLRLVEEEEL